MPFLLDAVASRRRLSVLLAALIGALAALAFVPAGRAHAADGPAPAPRVLQLISDVHADAIATFWDDGELVLDSKADTPELHTRYGADDVWFHVDDDSRFDDLPAGYEFVAPGGSTIWLAPEVQQSGQIWPGFSTESVPAGTLDNDDTTLTLTEVEGPGDVELWQTGSFGAAQRLWSSDEAGFKSFTRKSVHMHANWAFTAAGVYRLTVRADAAVDGSAVSDTATYTFVVGELPDDADTTTTLAPSATAVGAGDAVELTATVSPAGVEGNVEFRDGSTVLGHDRLEAGTATLTVTDLALGSHDLTAVFVPETENLADGSTSPVVTVDVSPALPEPVATTITAGAIKQVYGRTARLSIQVAPGATGQVAVRAGARTVYGTLNAGQASVTVPARALTPGARSVTVSYAGVAGEFAPASRTVGVTVVKATATLATRLTTPVRRGRTATVVVRPVVSGLVPTGRVSVRIAGRSRTVALDRTGKATVRIAVPRRTRPGVTSVVVGYGGSAYVAKAAARTTVRVRR